MRPGIFLGSVVFIAGLGIAIMAGGQAVSSDQAASSTAGEDEAVFGSFEQKEPGPLDTAADAVVDALAGTHRPNERVGASGQSLAQAATQPAVTPDATAATSSGSNATAMQYKKKILYRPVAVDAGTIDAMGYRLVIAGVIPLEPEAKCDFEGKAWPCGVRARTEFRAWLRDRAVTCEVPTEPSSRAISTHCHIGTDDAGKWLVENGWARAETAGPYAGLGKQAQDAKRGVFGKPPALMPETLVSPEAANLPEPLPAPGITATPPADLSGPSE
ncbi:thermonuclease family protein [Pseudaminobacter salicylatoxidans]|uniref:thermonuclease family protein n=1 Tax=Pseudaminobacter salicylatoxidans TaxID=93369 RepID=UPI0002DAE343|nr:hypothetical protein [Pseudaminobacter salicylatoxidans]